MTTPIAEPVPPAQSGDRQTIEDDIERTREQLGDTVEALTRRLDVKTRLRDKATHSTQRAKMTVSDGAARARNQPARTAAVATALLVVVGLLAWRRRG